MKKNQPAKLEIKNLADCKEHLPQVASWLWKRWYAKDGVSRKDIEYQTMHCLGKKSIPMTFVGLIGKVPVATVSLWTNDLESRQDLWPWLAALFVVRRMRHKGIGTLMQEFAIAQAKKQKFKSIYLITKRKNYYEKSGWSFIELAPLHNGKKERIYVRQLRNSYKY